VLHFFPASKKDQPSILTSRIYLARHFKRKCLSIYSTNLYQWSKIPILQNNRFARILRAGGHRTQRQRRSRGWCTSSLPTSSALRPRLCPRAPSTRSTDPSRVDSFELCIFAGVFACRMDLAPVRDLLALLSCLQAALRGLGCARGHLLRGLNRTP
jgi:hypothetical protein